jgi:hypothetical protein
MNPIDVEHALDRHETDLNRIAKDLNDLKPLREAIYEMAKALRFLREIYSARIGAFSSESFQEFNHLLDSATEKARQPS